MLAIDVYPVKRCLIIRIHGLVCAGYNNGLGSLLHAFLDKRALIRREGRQDIVSPFLMGAGLVNPYLDAQKVGTLVCGAVIMQQFSLYSAQQSSGFVPGEVRPCLFPSKDQYVPSFPTVLYRGSPLWSVRSP